VVAHCRGVHAVHLNNRATDIVGFYARCREIESRAFPTISPDPEIVAVEILRSSS